jgi:hypothetical protein
MERLRSRIRRWTLFFIAGLVLSGATALAIPSEMEALDRALGHDMRAGGAVPESAAVWLRTVRDGVRATSAQAPFFFYGTDWLAFGHFMIALVFVGALADPARNRWLFVFGMLACALVPLWALAFGHLRGIPPWWRLIDCTFGVVGFVPMWLCHRWSGALTGTGDVGALG